MKKKVVHKVYRSKKIISKISRRKTKFTLKSWFLGGALLLLAATYSLYRYNLLSGGIKVLEIPGDITDYLLAEPISVNEVCVHSKDEERVCYDKESGKVTSGVHYTNGAVDKITTTKTVVEKDPDLGVVSRTEITNTRDIKSYTPATKDNPTPDYETKVGGTNTNTIQVTNYVREDTDGDGRVEEDEVKESKGNVVIRKVENVNTDKETTTITETDTQGTLLRTQTFKTGGENKEIPKLTSSSVNAPGANAKGGCSTVAGFSVLAGSTMIGSGDVVYECTTTGWKGQTNSDGTPLKCTADQVKNDKCSIKITIKPIYAQQPGQQNCYEDNGALVIGNGSVQESGGGSGRRCDNGSMTEVKKVDGHWLSAEDQARLEAEADDERENKCKGSYNPDTNICTHAPSAAAPPANPINPNGTKKPGDLTTNPSDCVFDGTPTGRGDSRSAEFRCNDSNGMVPGVKIVHPSGKYKNGEKTSTESDCFYGGDPIVGTGRSQGTFYNCRNSAGVVPRTYVTGPGSFGDTPQTQAIIKDTSGEALAACRALIQQAGGGECLEQGPEGSTYIVNFVPPSTIVNQGEAGDYPGFDSYQNCTADDGFSGTEMECVKTPDGRWSQVPDSDPHLNCSFIGWITFQGCQWKEVPESSSANSGSAVRPTEKKLLSGDSCEGNDASCESGDCRSITNPEGQRGYYCMPKETTENRPWYSEPLVLYVPPLSFVSMPVQQVQYMFSSDNQLAVGSWCHGNGDKCSTGYCADNWFAPDTCEISPFPLASKDNNGKRCSPKENESSSIESLQNGNWEYTGITCPFGCEDGQCKNSE